MVSSRPIEAYDARVTAELNAYAEVEEVHDLPPIHHLWAQRAVYPLFAELDLAGIDDLWERSIELQCRRKAPAPARLVSLGAGNGDAEQQLAVRLRDRGVTNLELVLLELNPAMVQRAFQTAERLGLGERVRAQEADLNTWIAAEPADIYLAVHSLHHVAELEHLYDQVEHSLDPDGVLLVNDMVGRNGHVRWPEAGTIVRAIWQRMPERYRYNHYSDQIDAEYPDIDCSGEGFEGIRAQDVLPLLLERFHPELYISFGNVVDPFVDRVYGPNFDPDDAAAVEFVERVAQLDEAAIDLGVITPTHLVATFRARPTKCRYPRNRSPEHTVRDPLSPPDGHPAVAALEAQLRAAEVRYGELRSRKMVRLGLALARIRRKISLAIRK